MPRPIIPEGTEEYEKRITTLRTTLTYQVHMYWDMFQMPISIRLLGSKFNNPLKQLSETLLGVLQTMKDTVSVILTPTGAFHCLPFAEWNKRSPEARKALVLICAQFDQTSGRKRIRNVSNLSQDNPNEEVTYDPRTKAPQLSMSDFLPIDNPNNTNPNIPGTETAGATTVSPTNSSSVT